MAALKRMTPRFKPDETASLGMEERRGKAPASLR